jgi:RHS repeat-associated protein
MSRLFSKAFLRALPKMGMKFINALMLTSMLLTNITGVVQARAESRNVPGKSGQESPIAVNAYEESKANEYVPPVFEHPEARLVDNTAPDASSANEIENITTSALIQKDNNGETVLKVASVNTVQARAENWDASKLFAKETLVQSHNTNASNEAANIYKAPVFTHPEARVGNEGRTNNLQATQTNTTISTVFVAASTNSYSWNWDDNTWQGWHAWWYMGSAGGVNGPVYGCGHSQDPGMQIYGIGQGGNAQWPGIRYDFPAPFVANTGDYLTFYFYNNSDGYHWTDSFIYYEDGSIDSAQSNSTNVWTKLSVNVSDANVGKRVVAVTVAASAASGSNWGVCVDDAQFISHTTPRGYWIFDENSGTIAHDQGWGMHEGTLNGGTSLVNGRYYDATLLPTNYALQFNGEDTYVSVLDDFNPTAYTIAMWVKPTAVNSNIFVRTTPSGPTVNWSHNVFINSGGYFCTTAYDQLYGTGPLVCGTTKVNTTTPMWYHVTSTAANNGQLRLYVNGVQEGTSVNIGTLWTGGDRYYIGSNRSSLGYFSGAMDEVRLYDSALSAADISTLYKADQSVITPPFTPIIANNVDPAEVQVILKDGEGHVLANHVLVPSVSGTGNTISPTTAQTDNNGVATFAIKSTKAETKIISIFDQTQAVILERKPTITFKAGPASLENSTIQANLTGVTNDGVGAKVIVTVLDEYSNPIPDVPVKIEATGSATIAQSSAVTDSQGIATTTLIDTVAETVILSAAIGSAQFSHTFSIRLADTVIDMPRGYWAFDDNYGTTAYDQGLGAHNGALVGTVDWASGRYYDTTLSPTDHAILFNGTNTYASVMDDFDPTAYTIAMWVKPTTINRNVFVRTNASGPLSSVSHNIYINSSGYFCAYTYDGAGKSVCSTTKVNTTTPMWYHVASTAANNGQLKLYVNGVQEGTPVNIGALWTGGDRYYIGSNRSSFSYFAGAMDDVRFYNSVLSVADIWALYKQDQSTITTSPDVVIANNVNTAEVQVTLKDWAGNVLANHILAPSVSGTGNTISPTTVQTDNNGLATFTIKSTKAETKIVTIFDQTQSVVLERKPTITFRAGPVNSQKSTLTTNLTGVTNDGVASATITAIALDAYNNPVPDLTVNIIANGSAVVTQTDPKSDTLGRATASIRDGTPELVTVSAIIDNTQILQTVDIRFHCKPSGELVIISGDSCSFNAGTYDFDSIEVKNAGTLILIGDSTAELGVTINTDTMIIDTGGVVTADGRGYPAGTGPGAGAHRDSGGGAGYGGNGGYGRGAPAGIAYGDMYEPFMLGSGGGYSWKGPGGAGGGAIKIIAKNMLVDGNIFANGMNGNSNPYAGAGGGSGGSIWIVADTLAGTGKFSANGGYGGSSWCCGSGGGGAGGRIAVYTTSLAPTIKFSKIGGGGESVGEAGTLYLDGLDPSLSTLTISPESVTADGTSLATATVTLKNKEGIPVPNRAVEIALDSGSGLSIDNQYVAVNQYVAIGITNSSGVATAKLKTTIAGIRTLKARSGQELISQQGIANFVPGPVSPTTSYLTANSTSGYADGHTPITVTVTARDDNNNLIQGADVVLQSTGDAVITQPASATNTQGKTSGQIVDSSAETVTVYATVNGVLVNNTINLAFNGSDLALSMTGPDHALANSTVKYTLTVHNTNERFMENVTLELELPEGVSFVGQNSPVTPTQSDQMLTWNLGTFDAGHTLTFDVDGQITASALPGDNLDIQASVASSTLEANLANNEATRQTTIVGGDLALTMAAPENAVANSTLNYTLTVQQSNDKPVENVTLQLQLPAGVTYISQNSAVTPTQSGQILTWNLETVDPDQKLSFDVSGYISASTAIGTVLNAQASIATTTPELTLDNNTAASQTNIIDGRVFIANISPTSHIVSVGASTTYDVVIRNTGKVEDQYTVNVSGLNPQWYTLTQTTVNLLPGESTTLPLTVQTEPNTCSAVGTVPFEVGITSNANQRVQTLSGSVVFESEPQVSGLVPMGGSMLGSRDVTINWQTDSPTTGVLKIFPSGSLFSTQTFNSDLGTFHSIVVPSLERNTTYEWAVDAISACGTTSLSNRTLTIGNGIVFVNRNQNVTVDRDYNQLVKVAVRNDDVVSHTLTTSIPNPYEDLIISFVDNGSSDQTITLEAGETRQVTLAIHTQDAKEHTYDLTPSLVADKDSASPIYDNMSLHVNVVFEGDYTIEEDTAAFDELTLARTYVITNHGKPITDLSLTAVDPATGEPARIFLQPSLDHARLETGQSIRVTAYPIFTAEDAATQVNALNSPQLASSLSEEGPVNVGLRTAPLPAVAPINYNLKATGSGVTKSRPGSVSCGGDKTIVPVAIQDCTMTFNTSDWYCTNRPNINTPIAVPSFLASDSISLAKLSITYAPHSDVQPHNGQIYFNETKIGAYTGQIPNGQYSFLIPASTWHNSQGGSAVQNVQMNTQHPNPGHYVSATGLKLEVAIDQATTYVCADSDTSAQQIVQSQYACTPGNTINSIGLYSSLFSSNNNSASNSGGAGPTESQCPTCPKNQAQGNTGDPINTKNGTFSMTLSDLSFPTSAGELIFQREYSSGATEIYTAPLGYGWTFNHDAKLIFPTDPDGTAGFITFQSATGNQAQFKIEADGSYTPELGLTASLTKSNTDYLLKTSEQKTFRFNLNGRLLERTDEQGRAFAYGYDTESKLTKVSADSGVHFIQIGYDTQGRIVSVKDHADREVTYTYDASGDLATSKDVLGQVWRYTYNSDHRMTQIKDPAGTQTLKTEYDLQGRAFKQFDGKGNLLTNIVYNADGTSTLYNALGKAEVHAYDERNTLIGTSDPTGADTSKTYDDNFRPATITDAGGDTTTLTWSADGANLTKVKDAEGNETSITYDALNNPIALVDAGGFQTTFGYEGKLLTSSKDALNQETTYTYTPEGYLKSTTLHDPQGNIVQTTSYTYDSYGQRTSMTDSQNHTWRYSYDELGRLTDTTDPLERVTHSVYDAAGRLTSQTVNYDPAKSHNQDNLWNITTEYVYDERGNQIAVTDTLDRTIQYIYDDAGRLITTKDPEGNITSNAYNAAGQLVSTTDTLGRVTRYTYDDAGRLIKTIDPLGNATSTAYNPDGTVASTTDALGRTTSYTYDSLKRVTAVTQPNGGVTHNTYDDLGNLIETRDALGNSTHYEYDALGRQIKTIYPPAGPGQVATYTENFYNPAGQLVQTKDARGNATTYDYDAAGRQTSVTDALGNVTSYEYDALGRRISTTDAMGNKTSYTYDELNRTVAVTDALGHTSTTTYDALGQTLARTDPNNQTVSFDYDNLGRLISQSDALNHSVSFTYDVVGNRLTATDANGHTSSSVYDALNRVISMTDSNDISTSNGYDAVGNLISSTNGLSKTTTTTYNALNQPVISKDALGNETTQSYNARGELVSTTDANGISTGYEYDALGHLTAVIENYKPGFQSSTEVNVRTEYTYDANGNRLTIKDGNGHVTTFAYDALDRLVSESDPLGNTWTYAYDKLGNRISMTDANGAVTNYVYDKANHLSSIDYPDANDVSFVYDDGGRRTSMTDSTGTTRWTYNAANQVTDITDPFNKKVSYEYDPAGNRAALVYPDNTRVSYDYDPGNRLTSVVSTSSSVSYGYDAANRLKNILRANNVSTDYIYDDASRLLSITHKQGTETLSSFQYTYDKVGNRTQAIETMPQMEPPSTDPLYLSDDMEAGAGNWNANGGWTQVDLNSHSPSHAWSLNPTNDYQRSTDYSLELTRTIAVPADAKRPELTFFSSISAASDSAFNVEVTTDGGTTWEVLKTYTSSHNRTDWVLYRIPLDAHKGEDIRIRFRAVQGSSWTKDQWLVDDVRLGERTAPAQVALPFADDLEGGAANWEMSGQWSLSGGEVHSGASALNMNPTNDYQRSTDFSVELAGQVNVPADAARPELSWYDHLNVASDTTLTVEATTDDGVTWNTVTTFTSADNRPSTGSGSDWILRRASLDAYKGQSIRLRFHAVQGSSWTKDVWVLDDIRIGARAAAPALAYPFSDGLENGSANWEFNGQWSSGSLEVHTGSNSLDLNPTNDYQRSTDFSAEMAGQVTVPADAARPEISWYDHLNIAADTTLKVEATTDDGLSWAPIATFTSLDSRSDWIQRSASLESFKGQAIRIRFRAVQGSSWTKDTWRLDDISIGEHQASPQGNFPFTTDLESGLTGWQVSGQWSMITSESHSAAHAWSLNPTNDYQRSTDFSLAMTTAITIPSNAARPELTYYDRLNIASDTTLTIEASVDDGVNWTPIKSYSSAHNRSDWVLRRASLDAYKGQTIRLRFRAAQGSSWTKDVWMLDDIRVGEHLTQPALGFPYQDAISGNSGFGNFEPDGQWAIATNSGHGDGFAWSLNPTNDYQRSTDFSLELSGQVAIPSDAIRPELTYEDRLNIASDTTLNVEATTDDGLTWTPVKSYSSAYNRSDWVLRRASLDAYKGQSIRLRFRAIQGSAWTKDVWDLDNLRVGERQMPPADFPFEDLVADAANNGNWQPDGQWVVTDGAGSGDSYSWSLNPTNDYQRSTNFALTLNRAITLPSGATNLKLSYFDRFTLASDTNAYVEISTDDGLNWTTVSTFKSANNTTAWTRREVSLAAYAGQTALIRFRAAQGSSWTKDTWQVDAIRIGGDLPPTATPTATATQTSTPTPSATATAPLDTLTPTATETPAETSTPTVTPTPAAPDETPTETLTPEPTATELSALFGDLSLVNYNAPTFNRLLRAAKERTKLQQQSSTTTTTIDYTYDPLYRLTAANYSNGDAYHYAYDTVGNRLTQDSTVNGHSSTVSYTYDNANRLANVTGTSTGSVSYTFDANGNLLSDGVNIYTYDAANRLTTVNGPSSAVSYRYNGLGDRLSQNGVNYTLDLNSDLTQVLSDGTTSYTYGIGRISQQSENTAEYFLGDALGSVRQLVNNADVVALSKSYDPYGNVTQSSGNGQSAYGYTGETADANGLIYLRARYYNPVDGRFMSRDAWAGSFNSPQSLNRWNYAQSNPIIYTDPDGHFIIVATMAGGAVIGAALGAGIYAATKWYKGETIDTTEALQAAAVGAVGGLLIGTGVGAATGVAAIAAIGAGSGVLAGQAGYAASTALTGNRYDSGEMLISATIGGIAGGVSGLIAGGIGLSVTGGVTRAVMAEAIRTNLVAQAVINGAASFAQYELMQRYRQEPTTLPDKLRAVGSGVAISLLTGGLFGPNVTTPFLESYGNSLNPNYSLLLRGRPFNATPLLIKESGTQFLRDISSALCPNWFEPHRYNYQGAY